MNEEQKNKMLLDKINQFNFDFNDEEFFIIQNNSDVLDKTINSLNNFVVNNLNNENVINKNLDLIKKLCEKIITEENVQMFNQNVTFLFIKELIKEDFYGYFELNELINLVGLNDELRDKILEHYYKYLKENNYKNIDIYSEETLLLLLENKRYDLLNYASINFELSLDLKNKFKENDLKIRVERVDNLNWYKNDLYLLTFESLIKLIEILINKNEPYDYFLPYLDKELERTDDNYLISIRHNWDKICEILPSEYKEKITNKLIRAINSNNITSYYWNEANFDFDYQYNETEIFKSIIPALIIEGFLNILPYTEITKNKQKVIELIKNNPSYREKISTQNIIIEDMDLLKVFFSYGISCRLASTSINLNPDKLIEEYLDKGLKIPLNGSPFIPSVSLLEKLLTTENLNLLKQVKWNFVNYQELTEDIWNSLEKTIANNISLYKDLISYIEYNGDMFLSFINKKNILNLFFNIDNNNLEKVVSYISHNDGVLDKINKESLDFIIDKIIDKTKLNEEHFKKLKDKFGYEIIVYFQNKSIVDLINLPEVEFNKLVSLFSINEYNTKDLETSYDALKQYEFGMKNPDIVSIFNNILVLIENNDLKYLDLLNNIEKVLDNNFYLYFKKVLNDVQLQSLSPKDLLIFVTNKIKDGIPEEKDKFKDILHIITTYYLDRMRGLYRLEYDIFKDLNIKYKYELTSLKNAMLQRLITDEYRLVGVYLNDNQFVVNFRDFLLSKMKEIGIEEDLSNEIIYYYKYHKQMENSKYDISLIKSNIKNMVKIAESCKEVIVEAYNLIEELDNEKKIKRIYDFSPEKRNIYKLLSELSIKNLEKKLLSPEKNDIYESLNNLISKNKIHLLPDCILKKFQDITKIEFNYEDIIPLINYYHNIYEKYKGILESNGKNIKDYPIGLVDGLINASLYSATSLDAYILGIDDYRLIKSNTGPHAAYRNETNYRLKESIERTFENFKRDKVAIPTFNEVLEIENGKSMRVIVGNFTHPSNLTHGERTGACMRIGGAGDSLYKFCLDNDYGFHIRFEDPKTGEYISRVSGFRNGNTVFLNELRYSCNSNLFSNIDIVNACQKASKMIIEMSKNSPAPIENVVIARQYAINDSDLKEVNLDVPNIKEGFDYFYSDVSSFCVVLTTTAKEEKFVPVNLDNSKVEMYKPARETIKEIKNPEIAEKMINRVRLIKNKLETDSYEYMKTIFGNDLIYCIANQDWYIYVDKNLNIHGEYINLDKRAIIEYNNAMSQVEDFVNEARLESGEVKHAI